jgi:hypothetical protein
VSHPPTWQVIGTAEYAPNPWLNLQLGYRNLNFNYQASGRDLGFNVHMKGPIIAATFRFSTLKSRHPRAEDSRVSIASGADNRHHG